MDWLIALIITLQSLTSAADHEAKAAAERLQAAVRLETSYYPSGTLAEQAMQAPFIAMPSSVDQGDALMVRSQDGGQVEWAGKKVPLQPFGTGYYALLSVPTDQKPGTYTLSDGKHSTRLTVLAKNFDTDRLTVTKEQESMWQNTARIEADQRKIDGARSRSEASFLYEGPFVKPVEGRLSTPYGYTRYVNGVFNSIHRAVDLAAPEGTPVLAANSGKVVLAEELYLTGNSIYIDHGMSLFSQYAHLSKLRVHPGDNVRAGQVIGEVGSTGFSTGPHLHFTFWVNGTPANPERFWGRTPFEWLGH